MAVELVEKLREALKELHLPDEAHSAITKIASYVDHLETEVGTLRAKLGIPNAAHQHDDAPLDDECEKLLQRIANAKDFLDYFDAADTVGSRAKGEYDLDILVDHAYIENGAGVVYATPDGRKYLAKRNLL